MDILVAISKASDPPHTGRDFSRRLVAGTEQMHFTIDTDLAIVGILIGVLALAMAAPPLLQLLYGRPQLEFSVDEFTGPDGKQLLIAIKNKGTRNLLLKRMGVEREVGNILAYFDIQEQGTNRFVKKDIRGLLHCAPTRESALILARALPSFTVGLSVIHAKENTSWIIDGQSDGQFDVITVGDYRALATIICGEQVHQVSRNFKIGPQQHLTFWV